MQYLITNFTLRQPWRTSCYFYEGNKWWIYHLYNVAATLYPKELLKMQNKKKIKNFIIYTGGSWMLLNLQRDCSYDIAVTVSVNVYCQLQFISYTDWPQSFTEQHQILQSNVSFHLLAHKSIFTFLLFMSSPSRFPQHW